MMPPAIERAVSRQRPAAADSTLIVWRLLLAPETYRKIAEDALKNRKSIGNFAKITE